VLIFGWVWLNIEIDHINIEPQVQITAKSIIQFDNQHAVFEAAMRVKSTHLIKSCLKTRKKRENMEMKFFYINIRIEDRLDTEFTAC